MFDLFLTAGITESQALTVLGVGVSIVISSFVLLAFVLAGFWKVFTKFGEPGWKALIPLYNQYVEFQYIWNTKMFIIMLVLSAVFAIVNVGDGSTFAALIGIPYIIVYVMALHKLSKSFGHGGGFTFGLVVFPFIFMLILGFGKSEYIGNTSKGASEEDSMKTL